jgi:transposase
LLNYLSTIRGALQFGALQRPIIQPYVPPEKPKTGRPRSNLRQLFNGILYALKTGCTWANVPRIYRTKSTIHRFHLELCRKGIYGKIFNIMLAKGYKGQDGSGILSFHQQVSRKIDLHFPS